MSPSRLSVALATVVLVTLPAAAQDKTGEAAAAVPAEETTPEKSAEKPDAKPSTEPESEGSPFDYRASEQISEDLSVSFPVDI